MRARSGLQRSNGLPSEVKRGTFFFENVFLQKHVRGHLDVVCEEDSAGPWMQPVGNIACQKNVVLLLNIFVKLSTWIMDKLRPCSFNTQLNEGQ